MLKLCSSYVLFHSVSNTIQWNATFSHDPPRPCCYPNEEVDQMAIFCESLTACLCRVYHVSSLFHFGFGFGFGPIMSCLAVWPSMTSHLTSCSTQHRPLHFVHFNRISQSIYLLRLRFVYYSRKKVNQPVREMNSWAASQATLPALSSTHARGHI